MDNENQRQELLPLGSVVTLNNGDGTKVVIIGRLTITEDKGIRGYFEYSSVIYPNGIVDANQLLFFNSEDIKEVFHTGFIDKQEIELQQQIINIEIDYPKLSVDN